MRFVVAIACVLWCVAASAGPHLGFETTKCKQMPGAAITKFYAVSKARNSGLRPGWIVVAINGRPVKEPKTIELMMKNSEIGDVVSVTAAEIKCVFMHYYTETKTFGVELVDEDEAVAGGFLEW